MIQQRRTVVLFFQVFLFLFIFLRPAFSYALELESAAHYSTPQLYERYVQKVLFSKARNKLFTLHGNAITILDLSSAPPLVKYYTVTSGAPLFLPNHGLYDMLYDDATQKLFVSAAWPGISMKLVVLDEPHDAVLSTLDISTPRFSPFRNPGAIYSMKLHQGKVYFLASATDGGLEYSILGSYDVNSGAYKEYISRNQRHYYDYDAQTLTGGGPADGAYQDFDFVQENPMDDEFVMVSDVYLNTFTNPWSVTGWGSILKGNVSRTEDPIFSGSQSISACPFCTLGQCEKFGGGGLSNFFSYSAGDMGFINYSVPLPPNSPNVRVVYNAEYGVPPLDSTCHGYGDIFYGAMYADNEYQGGTAYNLKTNEKTLRAKTVEIRAEDILNRTNPLMGNTASTLSSFLTVTTIPPHIHTKLTYDGEPAFLGGLRKVMNMGSDIFMMGFQLDPGESFNTSHLSRNDILVLSQNTLTNLSKTFSLPRNATAIARFGNDIAVTLDRNKVAILNKTGVKFISESLRQELYTVAADAEAGIVVVAGNAGVDVLKFKADKLITEFAVKPDSKLIYPYADGPTGTDAEAKVNFTLAKDAKITVTVEDASQKVLTTLVNNELFVAGEYTFEAKPDKKGDGIVWTGTLDDPLLKIKNTVDVSVKFATEQPYILRLTAKDASSNGSESDTRMGTVQVITP